MHQDRVNGAALTLGHDIGTWEAVGANYALGPGINIQVAVKRADVSGGATPSSLTGLHAGALSDHARVYSSGSALFFEAPFEGSEMERRVSARLFFCGHCA